MEFMTAGVTFTALK